jgi:2-aminoadipate transaminase
MSLADEVVPTAGRLRGATSSPLRDILALTERPGVVSFAGGLPAGSTHNRPEGGMFVWARLPDGWDATALLPRALERDVAYVPGAPFFTGPPDPATLRLSFTAHQSEEIRRGLERLAGAMTDG